MRVTQYSIISYLSSPFIKITFHIPGKQTKSQKKNFWFEMKKNWVLAAEKLLKEQQPLQESPEFYLSENCYHVDLTLWRLLNNKKNYFDIFKSF